MRLLIEALVASWNADTAAPGSASGGAGSPAGQCAVTALVVQDYLDGEILRTEIPGLGSHYWNRVPGGGEVDLTRAQYHRDLAIPRGVAVLRSRPLEGERAAAANTLMRYRLLAARVRSILRNAAG